MRYLALLLTFLLFGSIQNADAYDPNFSQKVKYNQSRAKWKIKEGRESLKKRQAERERERARRYNQRSSSSSSNSTYGSSNSRKAAAPRASGSADQALRSFIAAANRATSIEQLYPYALKNKTQYWHRLNPKAKQKALMDIKKWTYHSRILGVADNKGAVATIKLSGGAKGVHMWVENGRWKFSDVIK